MLYEGENKDSVLENRHELFLHIPDQTAACDIAFSGFKKRRLLARINKDTELFLERAWDQAVVENEWREGTEDAPPNAAVKLKLSSQLAGADETLWLIEHDPDNPMSSILSMGPATIELKRSGSDREEAQETPAGPLLELHKKGSEKTLTVDLLNIPKGEQALPEGGLRLVNIGYFPDARVDENKLVSVSSEPNNPAIEFDVYDANGKHRHYVKFLLFPEFESIHGREKGDDFDIEYHLLVPQAPKARAEGPSLTLFPGDASWSYESRSKRAVTEGTLEVGKSYTTGWMDFSFTAEQLMNRAELDRKVLLAKNGQKGQIALELSLVKHGREVIGKKWVTEDRPLTIPIGGDQSIHAMIRAKERPVPFQLSLKDFRKIDYPGTNRPASFESDVRLHDTTDHFTIEKTISMNKPLDYKGYRIFQSSFVQDEQAGEASVFTVAKNPGILLIYAGAIITFLGGFLVFFVPAFSSLKF
jgi:hypothetical protein